MSSTGIATGLNKGFPVEKRTVAKRPSQNKRVSRSLCPDFTYFKN
jgi:hypothetical protein